VVALSASLVSSAIYAIFGNNIGFHFRLFMFLFMRADRTTLNACRKSAKYNNTWICRDACIFGLLFQLTG